MRVSIAVAIALSAVGIAATSSAQAAIRRQTNITAQELESALQGFAKDRDLQIIFRSTLVKDLHTSGVVGDLTAEETLDRLLGGTGLGYRYLDEKTVTIVPLSAGSASAPASRGGSSGESSGKQTSSESQRKGFWSRLRLAQAEAASASDVRRDGVQEASGGSSGESRQRVELEEIIVTGTNIRGVHPSSSPVEIYTAEDIARTGATTTEQFIQKLPQNLGTRTEYAGGSSNDGAKVNYDSVNSVDLRGLGIGTTLTLLNGRRLGASDHGRSVDVSLIPVGAIERVEVLTDGASAIYGSDAIGGVVNFVLKDDFEGAETRVNYGGVTNGNLRQGGFSQMLGGDWNSGRVLAAYNLHSASSLKRGDRDYAAPAGPGMLTPIDQRHNVLVTASQDIDHRLKVGGDFAFARRKIKLEQTTLIGFSSASHTFLTHETETDQLFGNVAVDYRVTDALNASVQASYSRTDVETSSRSVFFNLSPPFVSLGLRDTDHSTLDITGMLDGALFDLPGGAARFSVGGGLLDEKYQALVTIVGLPSNRDLGRKTAYAFGEVFAPLIGEAQGIPFAHRLELSLAGRYTRYDDTSSPALGQEFGDAFDPKIGLLWAPMEWLSFRGTYGTSFRAAALTELDPSGGISFTTQTTIAGVPARLLAHSGFPGGGLVPETAETFTVGFDIQPAAHPGLRFNGTYYSIEYKDRIAIAPRGADAFINPHLYPDAIYRAPSAAYIEEAIGQSTLHGSIGLACPGVSLSDRAAAAACLFALPNLWISDNRVRNLAFSEQDGFDLTLSNSFTTSWADISLGASITHIFDYSQQGSPGSPIVTVIDFPGAPIDLRGRAFASLSHGGFGGTINVNYVDDYKNLSTAGGGRVDSWTTVDVNLAYDFEQGASGLLNGLRLSLSVQNLFDEDPPFVNQPGFHQVGFDTANANPLGRLVVVGATKRW